MKTFSCNFFFFFSFYCFETLALLQMLLTIAFWKSTDWLKISTIESEEKCQWWSVKLCKLASTNSCQFIQLNSPPLTFSLEFPELFRKDNAQIPLDTCCLRLMEDTLLSAINGHSKRRAPIISRRFYFPRQNSGQAPIKNFLKSGQVISGHSVWRAFFSARIGLFSLFSLQLKDTLNNFEVILEARKEEYKKR